MSHDDALRNHLLEESLQQILCQANGIRRQEHGPIISYSRKVFIPLTMLCRNVCHYCTFSLPPERRASPYLTPDQVLAIAKAGELAGCKEALFTLGDKPEKRYARARNQLRELGCSSTVDYLHKMCELVVRETSLLPHVNAGVMTDDEIQHLRGVSVSQGIMLENVATRLCAPGQVHHGSPDKGPAIRLSMIRAAGAHRVAFTSGILIGIGETRGERIDSLLALRDLHAEYGHLQEIIIQNLRVKASTRMAAALEPSLDDLRWTIAAARHIFGPKMNIQAPPNLSPQDYPLLAESGINDWGGISPVTPDHVNPEAPWPLIETLRQKTEAAGFTLVERLALYPAFARSASSWVDQGLIRNVLRAMDGSGFARADAWSPGIAAATPRLHAPGNVRASVSLVVSEAIARAQGGERLTEFEIQALLESRGAEFEAVCLAADRLRHVVSGNTVRYVVNRNISYTNVCSYKCKFCAFSKSTKSTSLRGPAYDLNLQEVARRVREAWARGATEVCMQGGIHPQYTGNTYLSLLNVAKDAVPAIHVHAFSPLEVFHGATTLGLAVGTFLERLREAGLGTLPGTAAEILDDEVRQVLCPDKLTTAQWLNVVESAHRVGLRTTATIMFGHMERTSHCAKHLLAIRDLQVRTGGFTEFVPLPFVHMEAPMYFKGLARKGPTYREAVLMHAVARLALNPVLPNVQVSWVKMGSDGVRACLQAGANDLGGTLMNESISHAAGTEYAEELPPIEMDKLIRSAGRDPHQRTTLYGVPPEEQRATSYFAPALSAIVLTPPQLKRTPRVPGTSVSCLEAFV